MKNLNIVMYHYVRDLKHSRYPGIKGLDYSLFKQQIEFFQQNFKVVTMEEVIAFYNQSYDLPENAMLLTFDDGIIDHYTYVYPILKNYDMQGSFFIPGKTFEEHTLLDVNKIHFILASAPIEVLVMDLFKHLDEYRGVEFDYPSNEELYAEHAIANRFDSKEVIFFKRILQAVLPEKLRNDITQKIFNERAGISENGLSRELYLNYDQIKCMKDGGMFIGSHGYDHYWMNKLSEDDLIQDVEKGLESIGDFINPDAWVMNYPYGSYSEDAIRCVRNLGCKLGLSTDVDIAGADSNRFKLPRLDTNDFPPKSETYIKFK